MLSPSEIIMGIGMLKVAFPNYLPDMRPTAELWSALLGDLPWDTLKAAIMQNLAEPRQFAPSIGEIRQSALRLNAKAAGIPDALQAYSEVCNMPSDMSRRRTFEEAGTYYVEVRELKFSHPLVESVARLLGWPKSFPTDMPAADRSQFIKAYDAELSRQMDEAGRLKLVSDYINNRREMMGGDALALAANVTRQLEGK